VHAWRLPTEVAGLSDLLDCKPNNAGTACWIDLNKTEVAAVRWQLSGQLHIAR
jgi:hypothetical protein